MTTGMCRTELKRAARSDKRIVRATNADGPRSTWWRSKLCLGLGLACQNLLGHFGQLPCLPNTEVEHDLLRAAWHSHGPYLAGEALHFLALASAGVRKTTEDLRCLAGAVFKNLGALSL